MRKIKLIAIVALFGIATGAFFACRKSLSNKSNHTLPALYSGQVQVYDSIINNSGTLHNSLLDTLALMMGNYGHLDSVGYQSVMVQYIDKLTLNYGTSGLMTNFKENVEYGKAISIVNQVKNNLNNIPYLSTAYSEIANLLENTTDNNQLKNGLLSIYSRYATNCPNQYQAGLANMVSVAYSSHQYWQNNYDGWVEKTILITGNKEDEDKKRKEEEERKRREAQAQKEQRIANFVLADLAGAAVGAVPLAAIASAAIALSWD